MKTLRIILKCLGLAAALLAVLFLIGIIPAVQTQMAGPVVSHLTGSDASFGSVSAAFGRIDLEDARIEFNGTVLSVPALQARAPIVSSLWHRKLAIESLVAKGWTLDLTKSKGARSLNATASRDQVVRLLLGSLCPWRLPCEMTVDALEIEGEVVLPGPEGKDPTRIHLSLSGGGMGPGRTSEFTVDASARGVSEPVSYISAQGRLQLTQQSAQSVDAMKLTADVTLSGEALSPSLNLSAQASVSGSDSEETYSLVLGHSSRTVASLQASLSKSSGAVSGIWKLDLGESDVAPYAAYAALPSLTAAGEGRFEAAADLAAIHAAGRLRSLMRNLGTVAPVLERVGTAALDADFDLTVRGGQLHVDRLALALEGSRPEVHLRILQPFDFDATKGLLKAADANGDFAEGSVRGFPLRWFSGPADKLQLTGGRANADFVVRPAAEGFSLRLKAPLSAADVDLSAGGRPIARGLDVILPLSADYGPAGLQAMLGPMSVESRGRHLSSLDAKASRPLGAEQPVTLAGDWSIDLEALSSLPELSTLGHLTGKSASGTYTLKVGDGYELDCTAAMVGHDPAHVASTTLHADIDGDGGFSFTAPVKVAQGSNSSEVDAEGSVSFEREGPRLDVKLESEDVALNQLELLLAPVAAMAGGEPTSRRPFWGDLWGHANFSFKRLRTPDGPLEGLSGRLNLRADTLRLSFGRLWLLDHQLGKFEGTITFDSSKAQPYEMKGAGNVERIDAPALFGASPHGELPALEGHFEATASVSASGQSLSGLAADARKEIHLKGSPGVIRILKTSVADSIPEASTPVADTLGSMGSAVGTVFGLKKGFPQHGKNTVSKTAEAVMNFTYAVSELAYDELDLTAVLSPDGRIHLAEVKLTGPDVKLSGSGEISPAKGLPVFKRPLALDLQISVKGDPADLIAPSGLLASSKDAAGYSAFKERFQLGGTLEQVDAGTWHDLLARAATQKAPADKQAAAGAVPASR